MDFLRRMTTAVEYIENNINDEISSNDLAKIACCSVYQFGRVFSYIVGVPFSEYIRHRRLTLAAVELQSGKEKVIDVALKYGYSTPESFSRAFNEMHGVTPKEACALGVRLKLYPRITFHISIKGEAGMDYKIVERDSITLVGMTRNIGKNIYCEYSDDDANAIIRRTWDEFLDGGMNEVIRDTHKLYREPIWQMGVYQSLTNGDVLLAIGAESDGRTFKDLETYIVPGSLWAVFTIKGSVGDASLRDAL